MTDDYKVVRSNDMSVYCEDTHNLYFRSEEIRLHKPYLKHEQLTLEAPITTAADDIHK